MSIDSAKAFLKRLENDDDFRDSLGEAWTKEKSWEIIKKAGFNFTKKEFEVLRNDEDVKHLVHLHYGWFY